MLFLKHNTGSLCAAGGYLPLRDLRCALPGTLVSDRGARRMLQAKIGIVISTYRVCVDDTIGYNESYVLWPDLEFGLPVSGF